MSGYSDRINHALAFTAKHLAAAPPGAPERARLVHPANVAIVLTRYTRDHVTVEAGILHHVLEESHPSERPALERKICDKFGPVVLAVAKEAVEPRFDRFGYERPWQACKRDYLTQLANADPRAVDICVADEIHRCGSTIAALRRLGVEYLSTVSDAGSSQAIWWYRSLLELLSARPTSPNQDLLDEMRALSTDLIRGLRHHEEDL